jgi:hypothetical protein
MPALTATELKENSGVSLEEYQRAITWSVSDVNSLLKEAEVTEVQQLDCSTIVIGLMTAVATWITSTESKRLAIARVHRIHHSAADFISAPSADGEIGELGASRSPLGFLQGEVPDFDGREKRESLNRPTWQFVRDLCEVYENVTDRKATDQTDITLRFIDTILGITVRRLPEVIPAQISDGAALKTLLLDLLIDQRRLSTMIAGTRTTSHHSC